MRTILGLGAAAAVMAALTTPDAFAQQSDTSPPADSTADTSAAADELPNPAEEKRRSLKQRAIAEVVNGTATPQRRGASTVVKVASQRTQAAATKRGLVKQQASTKDQYVELQRETTDHIFVILTEFGTKRDPKYPDKDIEPSTTGPVTWDGPLHNKIPAPDRSQDNSTVWQPDYNQKHYQDLYFGTGGKPGSGQAVESVRQYFERQSSGRYSIDGTVTDWVKVDYNEARYGRSSDDPTTNGDDPNVCASNVCNTTWDLVRDAADKWYSSEIAKGRSKAAVTKELKSFDTWDRYDIDGDGDFNEPDGYLDHFQIVHAGGDEADGDPIQGEDAIWSHRWYAYGTSYGQTGPAQGKQGGTQIGDSGVWIGDYTIQPENGGMSVFAHEYTHDLGLPDLYDTNGGENSVNYWSLMAQSRESAPKDQAIGTRASDLGAWDKLQLGWLDYETVLPSQKRTLTLGPSEYNSAKPQAAVVVLPKKEVTRDLATPYAGTKSWWSGSGDDYTATMQRSVTLPTGSPAFTAQAQYNIEDGYDYAYLEVDDGSGWKSVPGKAGSVSTDPDTNGLTGDSAGAWVPLSYDLAAYAGKTVDLRVRYTTDGGVQGNDPDLPPGLFLDSISVGSLSDGAESGANGWTLDGFSAVGSTVTQAYDNYYIAANRVYASFDKYLQSGPYNFGWATTQPDRVEHFPYQDGLLVTYWDTSQSDNNTSTHPGEGLALPVDANPTARVRLDGTLWRPRVAGYDAPFGLQKSDNITLHVNGVANYIRGQAAVPVFRDDRSYWDASQPTASVDVPDTGTVIRVLTQDGTSMKVRVSKN
ncbi:M6 family metalloprotease domain-containing protein [Nocardioides mangrovicus]|uniref:M6 family metalloprotease domain-containing protein n=1 Tax=Nocardioides mangrovicus TaxID=2478913 RepID=A0A3L8P362_9ACTN|nr:immune inhibitor A domain-containing protein [Nocardioides mangrovicus]RLV49780.1 M6 family metalloprotease domain-containing protein [Nocardioides mangrovicus]